MNALFDWCWENATALVVGLDITIIGLLTAALIAAWRQQERKP